MGWDPFETVGQIVCNLCNVNRFMNSNFTYTPVCLPGVDSTKYVFHI